MEKIVMTPTKKSSTCTKLLIERKFFSSECETEGSVHVGAGNNEGIIVNKNIGVMEKGIQNKYNIEIPHLLIEFKVFLINSVSKTYTPEKRILRYTFKDSLSSTQRFKVAQNFFQDLVRPSDFPRDYVGFIKKIMKLLQYNFPSISSLEVELNRELQGSIRLPNHEKESQKGENTSWVLKVMEENYPNSLTIEEMTSRFKVTTIVIKEIVRELLTKGLIKSVGVSELGGNVTAFRRVHQNEDNVTIVKSIPLIEKSPTIAIITAQYYEKMAVDAMMSNKKTFLRYATNGEANVYTLGDIGSHRIVSTKLPLRSDSYVGVIATGSTTTRLLGTFQNVEHVFLVGLAGAVPHYTDFEKHVKLGDVVISVSNEESQGSIYDYCELSSSTTTTTTNNNNTIYDNTTNYDNNTIKVDVQKSWCPSTSFLQELALEMVTQWKNSSETQDWKKIFQGGLKDLERSEAWLRPSIEEDKLYMILNENDLIQVQHPIPSQSLESIEEPRFHCGLIASGPQISRNEQLRNVFAHERSIKAYDAEFSTVLDSIVGNRKEEFILIRGMSDYKDGLSESSWSYYGALLAASVMKSMIIRLSN